MKMKRLGVEIEVDPKQVKQYESLGWTAKSKKAPKEVKKDNG